jgi:hypothetical protein
MFIEVFSPEVVSITATVGKKLGRVTNQPTNRAASQPIISLL